MKINKLNKNGVIQAKDKNIEAHYLRFFRRKNVMVGLWHILNFSLKVWGHGKTVRMVRAFLKYVSSLRASRLTGFCSNGKKKVRIW